MRRILLLIAAGVAMARPAEAAFGEPGQLAPFGSVSVAGFLPLEDSVLGTSVAVGVAPGAFYFVADRWAVGGQALFGYSSDLGGRFSYGFSPGLGVAGRVSDSVSMFPQLWFTFRRDDLIRTFFTTNGVVQVKDSVTSVLARLYLPILFHPAEHTFLGIGPSFDGNLTRPAGMQRVLRLGLDSTIGIYF